MLLCRKCHAKDVAAGCCAKHGRETRKKCEACGRKAFCVDCHFYEVRKPKEYHRLHKGG